MRSIRHTGSLVVAAAAVLLCPADALAYLDAGSGSMIIQALAAGVFTAAIFFRQLTGWCRSLFHKPEQK